MSPIFKKQVPGKDTCIFRGCAYKKGKGTCSLVANTRLGNRRESPLILNLKIICNGATQEVKIFCYILKSLPQVLVLTNLATCCHKLYSMCLLLRTSQNMLLSFNSVLRVLSMDVLGLSIVYTLSDDFSNSKAKFCNISTQ